MKHTPGPWKVLYETNVMSGNRSVASCGGYSSNVNVEKVREENIANARLIAAVPDLLQELERSTRALEWWKRHHFLEWDGNDEDQLQNNRAAIAKAKGEATPALKG